MTDWFWTNVAPIIGMACFAIVALSLIIVTVVAILALVLDDRHIVADEDAQAARLEDLAIGDPDVDLARLLKGALPAAPREVR